MFGTKSASNDKQEAEQKRIDAQKRSFTESVANMRPVVEAGNAERCEAVAKRLADSLNKSKLPGDFKKSTREQIDAMVRDGFMKAADVAIKAVHDAALKGDKDLVAKKVKIARDAIGGAIRLKAPADFKPNAERALEAAMLSGGVQNDGPTKAKPLDTAPVTPNRAKPDDAYWEKLAAAEREAMQASAATSDPRPPVARKPTEVSRHAALMG